MKCHRCQSEKLITEKTINWTPKTGFSFHFRTHCKSCGIYKYCDRSLMPQEVRDRPWTFSLATQKRIGSGEVSKEVLLDHLKGMGMEVDEKSPTFIPLFFREGDEATQKPTTP